MAISGQYVASRHYAKLPNLVGMSLLSRQASEAFIPYLWLGRELPSTELVQLIASQVSSVRNKKIQLVKNPTTPQTVNPKEDDQIYTPFGSLDGVWGVWYIDSGDAQFNRWVFDWECKWVKNVTPLSITPPPIPNGITAPYTTTIAASGGLTPYTYAVTAGILPTGLSLNASTGVISGTPSVHGETQVFTITATDFGLFTISQEYSIHIT